MQKALQARIAATTSACGPRFGGLAAARMGSLSNLGTPQPSYRNLADGLSGSYTPTPVYRRISQDATTMLTSSVRAREGSG